LIGGTLVQHYGLEPARVMATLFPQTDGTAFAQKLIA
jgi:hypothetical protein